MNQMSPGKAGLVFGAIMGGSHLLWSIFIVAGWAQPFINVAVGEHIIRYSVQRESFDIIQAIILVASTSIVGCAFGYVASQLWNRLSNR